MNQMVKCTQILQLIPKGSNEEAEAMKMILQDERYTKAAYIAHRQYEKIHAFVGWEDVMYDAVMRFAGMVHREKKMEHDCLVYFSRICKNICGEYSRKKDRTPDVVLSDLFDVPKDLVPEMTSTKAEKLMQYFSRLSEKCQILLEAKYLWNPPENDNEELSRLVGGVPVPGSIPTTITRCKDDLRTIVGEHLNDLLNT
jgi:hypothetical protein